MIPDVNDLASPTLILFAAIEIPAAAIEVAWIIRSFVRDRVSKAQSSV